MSKCVYTAQVGLQAGYPTLIAALELFHKGERHDNLEDIRTLVEQLFLADVLMALEYSLDTTMERFGRTSRDMYTEVFEFGTVGSRLSLSSLSLKDLRTPASCLSTKK